MHRAVFDYFISSPKLQYIEFTKHHSGFPPYPACSPAAYQDHQAASHTMYPQPGGFCGALQLRAVLAADMVDTAHSSDFEARNYADHV